MKTNKAANVASSKAAKAKAAKFAKDSAAANRAWETRRAKATNSQNPSISAQTAWVTRRIADPEKFPCADKDINEIIDMIGTRAKGKAA